jgi:NAD(P)-dependent dehydrogenase (short-subunit alcohol dehydrogenase family)
MPGPPGEVLRIDAGRLRSGWGPTRRPGTPADIGGAVAALCSDDAQWVTGQTLVADGGASLMNPELPLDLQRP